MFVQLMAISKIRTLVIEGVTDDKDMQQVITEALEDMNMQTLTAALSQHDELWKVTSQDISPRKDNSEGNISVLLVKVFQTWGIVSGVVYVSFALESALWVPPSFFHLDGPFWTVYGANANANAFSHL